MTASGDWDVQVLREFFETEDIHRILATPANKHFKDSWRWLGDIRGIYSVKQGYQLLTSGEANASYTGPFSAWSKLWSLPVPPRTKHLLWRCARDILPVRENLKLKHVWIGGGCPLCSAPYESSSHLFGECWYAKDLWCQTDILQGLSIQHVMQSILSLSSTTKAVEMAAVFYVIWTTRNNLVWQNTAPSIVRMRNHVSHLQNLWAEAYSKQPRGLTQADTEVAWEPPNSGKLKCNVDAALFTSGAGFGAVVRDHMGRFVAARGGRFDGIQDPFMAETIAVREALSWLKTLHHRSFIIESDCLNFCNAFNSCFSEFSYVGTIIAQCRVLASDIGDVTVCHIRRSSNHVAHALARATGSMSGSQVWENIPPACISKLFHH
ncbi:PREDICTED: uncharacterized protein LOC109153341 [Ipomoea nil]|uniref:uncharacterized protein LOC109153341 n=1 Tax=Ipomoea nil TaxID=35883 RepID=UPI0009010E7F|nr:PREDICTED: uncharacterized protein LOC109153341 [Ipomoea nil]